MIGETTLTFPNLKVVEGCYYPQEISAKFGHGDEDVNNQNPYNMLNQAFITELKHEAGSTKRILERVPAGKFDWKPLRKINDAARADFLCSRTARLFKFHFDDG